MSTIHLKPGRQKSLLRRHPWVFSGAVASVDGGPSAGETVDIISADGAWLARGAFSPHSQMRVRVWTFDRNEMVDAELCARRLQRAVALRRGYADGPDNACRLVFSEGDRLPGLIVDRYGPYLVCQFLSAGAEYWKHALCAQLRECVPCEGIYERSDTDARSKEGLDACSGTLWGSEPPQLIPVAEDSCRYLVDVRNGHKTGFYLDQRMNRRRVSALTDGAEVLNCFSYTGGFGIASMVGGAAAVTNIDSSGLALEVGRRALEANDVDTQRVTNVEGDVFTELRAFRDRRRTFDTIILDPPKFVENRSQVRRGSRGYKDINLLACKLLRPGGLLCTFSCSGQVSAELFQKIVADAAVDAGRDVQIIEYLGQSPDHPVPLSFPEARYLKGLVCRVV